MALYDFKNKNGNSVLPMESGSNANGKWIKFADGRMIEYGIISRNVSFSPWGNVFSCDIQNATVFPIPFVEIPIVNLTGNGTAGVPFNPLISVIGISNVTVMRGTSTTGNATIWWVAIGRWK